MKSTDVSHLTQDTFDDFIDNQQIVVVYFGHLCEPCHQFKVTYENVCNDQKHCEVNLPQ